jgi:branched-chain amino acid transport system substrate-binding protein
MSDLPSGGDEVAVEGSQRRGNYDEANVTLAHSLGGRLRRWGPWLSFAQQPIRLGASLSLTGKYAVQGGYAREGYLLCQRHVNQQGGDLGRSVEFVISDDGSDEKTAVRLYEKLIAEDKVDAVIGPYSSNITDAVADVTEQHRKLMIAPMAATTSIWEKGRRYLIMMIAPAERLS